MKLSKLSFFPKSDCLFPDVEVDSVTENSAKADASALFVCIRGSRCDGHDFAANAYARGCRAFIAEKPLPLPTDALVITVPNTRIALSEIACHLYQNPSRQMHLIGITGTKGKTTTAQLLADILNQNNIPCGYIGTNGITYDGSTFPSANTTPDALTLQKSLRDMLKAGIKTAVIEVSSQALMQHRVDGTHFKTVLFTNLSPDHIGTNEHPDFEHYKACKRRLFTDFDTKCVIYNADDLASLDMLEQTSASFSISCSSKDTGADFVATDIELWQNQASLGVSFSVRYHKQKAHGTIPFIGRFNVNNALLALAAACQAFDVPLKKAVNAISNSKVSGRSEIIPLPNPAVAVIDYAHNEASLRQLLTSLREYHPTRLIVLFGSIGERAQLRRFEMGKAAAELADLCILTSDNPGNEPPEQIIDDISMAFKNTKIPFLKIPDRTEAIRTAVQLMQKGDILVLAGKGHEGYQLIGNQKIPFCEKDIITEEIQKDFYTVP